MEIYILGACNMMTQSLNGEWLLTIPKSNFSTISATVPGSVYHDLLRNGIMEDPYYRDNEVSALKLMDYDFHYSRSFFVEETLLQQDAVFLRCEGLDTIATILVNGQQVGFADNMHRIWEFDIKAALRPGENQIRVELASPTKYIKESLQDRPLVYSFRDAMQGFPNIRKAHCMFGWDWGPRLPDAGIWRDISLIGIRTARIRDVYVRQHHDDGKVTLDIVTNVTSYADSNIEVAVSVIAPDGKRYAAAGKTCQIVIEDPQLWWPSGFGEQPLYRVDVTLSDDRGDIDSWNKRIGLRTMTVTREKDQWGESFSHCVNGVNIFGMGANYIPEDNLLPRVTPERTRRLLEDAKAANMNVIRVWGGGYYPSDEFYDICDELGLLVWQDMMFACANYNLTDAFDENIRAEFVDNVRRLRHHASLALWCGNNENESIFAESKRSGTLFAHHKADYIKVHEYIIPQVLREEDPQTFFWPSSPSSSGNFDYPQDPDRGDAHYWDVWHGLKPFDDYRNHYFRYMSEFGFQSFPCMQTIESFTEPEDRNIFSYVMEKHQRNKTANGKIVDYLSRTYLYPSDLSKLVYASQLLQAQAMQYGTEHWRRNRGRCMGAIVWQLNDCWPVASWSSIDYYGRWKALHYYEKRFFAPVLISCHEEGTLSQLTSVNMENPRIKKSARLNVSNETRTPFYGTAKWSLRRSDASVIEEGSFSVVCPALEAVWLPEQDFSQYDTYGCYYAYELLDEAGDTVGQGSVLFCAPKHFRFADPQLTVEVDGDEIVVTAKAYARSVEIQAGPDTLLEDNYFDMNAGKRRVKILRGAAADISVRSVYDIR